MAALKMSVLTGMLALMGAFAPTALATGSLSAYTTTEATLSEQYGSTVSAGQVLVTWNVCNVIHQTQCAVSMSTVGPAPEPVPTGVSSVPEGYSSPPQGGSSVPAGSPSGPGGGQPGQPGSPTVPAPGKPGYTVPGNPGTQPGETHPGQTHPGVTGGVPGGEPTPTVISVTDESGNPTVVTSTPSPATDGHHHSGSHSASGSVSGTATYPSGSATYPSGSAPNASATGSGATTLSGILATIAGTVGVVAAYLL